MNKSTITAAIIGCAISMCAHADINRKLSSDEYGLLREAAVAMQCYEYRKAKEVDVQVPLFRLYAERPDVGKSMLNNDRIYIITKMNDIQFQDFAGIPKQVASNPGYYCSKYQK